MQKLLIAAIALLLTSCTTMKPVSYQCPAIILPSDPVPEINKLNPKSTQADVMKAWVATAIQYKEWNIVVHQQINDINRDD